MPQQERGKPYGGALEECKYYEAREVAEIPPVRPPERGQPRPVARPIVLIHTCSHPENPGGDWETPCGEWGNCPFRDKWPKATT